jgi:hypothetical protein
MRARRSEDVREGGSRDIYKSIYIFSFSLPEGGKNLVDSRPGGGKGPVALPVFKTGLAANIVAGLAQLLARQREFPGHF